MRAALRKGHGLAKDVGAAEGTRAAAGKEDAAVGKRAAAGKDDGATKDVRAARAVPGKDDGAAKDVGAARAAPGKDDGATKDDGAAEGTRTALSTEPGSGPAGGRKAARPGSIRGPGLSGSRRVVEAEGEMEGDEVETRGVSKQGAAHGGCARADITGDAWSDEEESQFDSNAPRGHGGGQRVAVPVEPPAIWHTSWEAWNTYLATYSERTKQVLPVRETMSRAERNKRLSKTKRGEEELVPEGFDPNRRVYICTHGWKKRKSRGAGKRPRQHICLTGCLARFGVQWNFDRRQLQVKNGYYVHNHEMSGSSFATYPSSRGVVDPLVGARVEGMLAVGAKRSKIYDYLLEHDQNVIHVELDSPGGHETYLGSI